MANEFKINPAIKLELAAVDVSGKQLNSRYVAADDGNIVNCSAASEYLSHSRTIKRLIGSYKTLIAKDISEIEKMVNEAEKTDQYISGAIR